MEIVERSLASVAEEARSWFTRGEREAGGIGKILLAKDDAPQWITDLCRDAHEDGALMPDDWRYEFLGDALDIVMESEEDDDSDIVERFEEWFDGAYIYPSQQTAWLHSSNSRYGYADQAREDYGPELDTLEAISLGMRIEAREVLWSVVRSLDARMEEES